MVHVFIEQNRLIVNLKSCVKAKWQQECGTGIKFFARYFLRLVTFNFVLYGFKIYRNYVITFEVKKSVRHFSLLLFYFK